MWRSPRRSSKSVASTSSVAASDASAERKYQHVRAVIHQAVAAHLEHERESDQHSHERQALALFALRSEPSPRRRAPARTIS